MRKIALVSGAAAVAGATLAATRHRAAAAADEVPSADDLPSANEAPPPDGGPSTGEAHPHEPPASIGRSRADLYEQAKVLGIPGRSRMRKAELERAVAEKLTGAAA